MGRGDNGEAWECANGFALSLGATRRPVSKRRHVAAVPRSPPPATPPAMQAAPRQKRPRHVMIPALLLERYRAAAMPGAGAQNAADPGILTGFWQ